MKRLVASFGYQPLFTKPSLTLNGFVSKDGSYYELSARIVNYNQIFYSVTNQFRYDVYSLYDGNSFEDAFDLYSELVLVFKGVRFAEQFDKIKTTLEKRINTLYPPKEDLNMKYAPLFLGDSELVQ